MDNSKNGTKPDFVVCGRMLKKSEMNDKVEMAIRETSLMSGLVLWCGAVVVWCVGQSHSELYKLL